MKASLAWLNALLLPAPGATVAHPLNAATAEGLLTFAGLPIDSTSELVPGDAALEVEVTSNRGDCLCHAGLARELAAASGLGLNLPSPPALAGPGEAGPAGGALIDNTLRGPACPRFVATVIRGVKVGPSPAWLAGRLAAIGQRSINCVVDVTNLVLHELGQPSHVFDLGALRGEAGKALLSVRAAAKGESLALLDGRAVKLGGGEVVICDAGGTRPVSLAGVMGGAETGVTERTTDVLLEVATWDPTRVRTAARRHSARTDSSHRYERVVDARTMERARARLVELIVQVAGGRVERAEVDGVALEPELVVELRPARLERVLGIKVAGEEIRRVLAAQGFAVVGEAEGAVRVRVPADRPDVTLEVDLIEEVARTIGYERLGVPELLPVRVAGLQGTQRARVELARVLTGLGFFEAVTFSFTSEKQAKLFTSPGLGLVRVGDDRRGEENVCRPSAVCGLLACRRANQDARVAQRGGVRLYELSAVFAQEAAGKEGGGPVSHELRTVALVADGPEAGSGFERRQGAVRAVRGAVEELVRALLGAGARVEVVPGASVGGVGAGGSGEVWLRAVAGFDTNAWGVVRVDGVVVGRLGLVSEAARALYDLQQAVAAAELDADALLGRFPGPSVVRELATMPAVERDVSLVVGEGVRWGAIEGVIAGRAGGGAALLESWAHVGTYRGEPLAAGLKSVTVRLVFRDAERTLRDEEVTPLVQGLVAELGRVTGATLRA
jgi:phenylalanyl-tRNA synthetase beta chain